MVSRSSGLSVRGSITSALMPSPLHVRDARVRLDFHAARVRSECAPLRFRRALGFDRTAHGSGSFGFSRRPGSSACRPGSGSFVRFRRKQELVDTPPHSGSFGRRLAQVRLHRDALVDLAAPARTPAPRSWPAQPDAADERASARALSARGRSWSMLEGRNSVSQLTRS